MNCNDCGGFLPRGCVCSPFGGRITKEKPMVTPERMAEIERNFARRMARRHALAAGKRGEHDYLPKTEEEARTWEPHDWVIQALIEARTENLND